MRLHLLVLHLIIILPFCSWLSKCGVVPEEQPLKEVKWLPTYINDKTVVLATGTSFLDTAAISVLEGHEDPCRGLSNINCYSCKFTLSGATRSASNPFSATNSEQDHFIAVASKTPAESPVTCTRAGILQVKLTGVPFWVTVVGNDDALSSSSSIFTVADNIYFWRPTITSDNFDLFEPINRSLMKASPGSKFRFSILGNQSRLAQMTSLVYTSPTLFTGSSSLLDRLLFWQPPTKIVSADESFKLCTGVEGPGCDLIIEQTDTSLALPTDSKHFAACGSNDVQFRIVNRSIDKVAFSGKECSWFQVNPKLPHLGKRFTYMVVTLNINRPGGNKSANFRIRLYITTDPSTLGINPSKFGCGGDPKFANLVLFMPSKQSGSPDYAINDTRVPNQLRIVAEDDRIRLRNGSLTVDHDVFFISLAQMPIFQLLDQNSPGRVALTLKVPTDNERELVDDFNGLNKQPDPKQFQMQNFVNELKSFVALPSVVVARPPASTSPIDPIPSPISTPNTTGGNTLTITSQLPKPPVSPKPPGNTTSVPTPLIPGSIQEGPTVNVEPPTSNAIGTNKNGAPQTLSTNQATDLNNSIMNVQFPTGNITGTDRDGASTSTKNQVTGHNNSNANVQSPTINTSTTNQEIDRNNPQSTSSNATGTDKGGIPTSTGNQATDRNNSIIIILSVVSVAVVLIFVIIFFVIKQRAK